MLFAHTYFFARYAYGNIPPHLGGGGTKDVQILLKIEGKDKEYFQSAGLVFYTDSNKTSTLKLLFANDDEYVFLVDSSAFPDAKGSTLSIKKDLVQAVLYEGFDTAQDPMF